jgi:hypothetical protein
MDKTAQFIEIDSKLRALSGNNWIIATTSPKLKPLLIQYQKLMNELSLDELNNALDEIARRHNIRRLRYNDYTN